MRKNIYFINIDCSFIITCCLFSNQDLGASVEVEDQMEENLVEKEELEYGIKINEILLALLMVGIKRLPSLNIRKGSSVV